jgi:glycosyltransferase involved in cell wall biosynthesis
MMANYNHARFLPEALDALIEQSYRPFEIVVLDDGSTDDSVDILDAYRSRHPSLLRVVKNERNRGVLDNAPRLVSMATGDYVYFAAADDKILPGFFERSMNCIARNPGVGLCSTLSYIMDGAGSFQGIVRMPIVLSEDGFLSPDEVLETLYAHGNWFMGNTTIYRRTAVVEAGGFRADLRSYCDGFASLVIARRYGACYVPAPLAVWRRMEGTYSQQAVSDIDATSEVIATAEQLMRTTYADLFPAPYIEQWKRDMHFGVAAAHASGANLDGFANARRLVPSTTIADRAFDSLTHRWPSLGRRLAKPFFFIKLKRNDIWSTIRRWIAHRAIAATHSGESGQRSPSST